MTSLKRSAESDPFADNIASKVFVRSTRLGKVQKIVREVYLRRDIPCSSPLCRECSQNIPRDAAGKGTPPRGSSHEIEAGRWPQASGTD